MSTAGVLVSIAVAGIGTLLMRLSGATRVSRRLAEMPWMRHVPLAVLLVLAVSSVTGGELRTPAPPMALGTVVVAGASLRGAPLLVNVVAGCVVYAMVRSLWPEW